MLNDLTMSLVLQTSAAQLVDAATDLRRKRELRAQNLARHTAGECPVALVLLCLNTKHDVQRTSMLQVKLSQRH